jgi:KUP system potassium uptake protein
MKEIGIDEDPEVVGDVKGKGAPRHGDSLPILALTALGIVYGDIGTSPLYAVGACFNGPGGVSPSPANVLGVLSLIFWTLIVVVTLKYHVYILRLDNRGEGGILALMNLAQFGRRKRARILRFIPLLGVFGAALLYGDGIITPAISVLSAVEGLDLTTPFLRPYVVPITVGILVGFFLVQSRGTSAIGAKSGPVMLVWFITLAALGIRGIASHPSVLAAINPAYAASLFARNGIKSFLVLGAVFLVATGGEALYADLGHFGERPIQIDWFSIVGPSLVLNYLGQGAVLIRSPTAVQNPFYALAPPWALYPLICLATLATIIASQAIVSGTFSLTRQAVQMGYLPRLEIIHTSAKEIGQIYVPVVNWVLMVATIGLVLRFRRSINLAAAYGIAVAITMVITTIFAHFVAGRRFRWPAPLSIGVTLAFLTFDLAFVAANIVKVRHGGWIPLFIAAAVVTVMSTWSRGRELLSGRLRMNLQTIATFVSGAGTENHVRVRGTAVFFSPDPELTPPTLVANFNHNRVLHDQIILLTVVTEAVSRVASEERLEVTDLGAGFIRAILHHGFMEEADVLGALQTLPLHGHHIDLGSVSFFVGKVIIIPSVTPEMSQWRKRLFAFMSRNSASAASFFRLPPNQVCELQGEVEI